MEAEGEVMESFLDKILGIVIGILICFTLIREEIAKVYVINHTEQALQWILEAK